MPSSARAGWTAAFIEPRLEPRQQEAPAAIGEHRALARDLFDDRALGDMVALHVAAAVDEDGPFCRDLRVDVEVDRQLGKARRGHDGRGVFVRGRLTIDDAWVRWLGIGNESR